MISWFDDILKSKYGHYFLGLDIFFFIRSIPLSNTTLDVPPLQDNLDSNKTAFNPLNNQTDPLTNNNIENESQKYSDVQANTTIITTSQPLPSDNKKKGDSFVNNSKNDTTTTTNNTIDQTKGVAIQVLSESQFCIYLPKEAGMIISENENEAVPYCTNTTLAPFSRPFPSQFIKTAHFNQTGTYVQVVGKLNPTVNKQNRLLNESDQGGQYDELNLPRGTCNQYRYWVNLIEPDASLYCIRCCKKKKDCNTRISTHGCKEIIPGPYDDEN
ncbi:hypothetical protein BJ944DRAFT_230656 [Cunninghamella echinulata]|nr:hypothetical protein BJ944DRAFT_230656 [Cunninghamella echinulata]